MGARGTTDFVRETAARAKALPAPWWLLVAAIATGTNAVDFFAAAGPDPKHSLAFILSALVRVLLVFWVGYAVLRRLADVPAPMRVGMPFLRTLLFMLGSAALMALATGIGAKAGGGGPRGITAGIVAWLVMTVVGMALVRLDAWLAALAVGDRGLGPTGAWRRLAGGHGGLALASLVISLVGAVHSASTRLALLPGLEPSSLLGLALVDGIVSSVQLVLGAALAVAAWRAATDRAQPLRDSLALA
ncbi:MAG: hypothetical protein JOZ90_07255 [Alphaproteobacteria bacterium]|nr:hypothetical protein [Alphaproteobacteria bacterium]MBV9372582.1 hypothetical protein [Alphaproteobacteria bacterium]MBV9900881.1 hypothetical protein [Alphaproteobacteria bacterium]